MNHRKKLRLVVSVIEAFPEAADDDTILLSRVWEKEGWDYNKDLLTNMRQVSRSETITRRRRQAFNMGLIKYSPKAMKNREKAFKNERERHSPDLTVRILNGEKVMQMTPQEKYDCNRLEEWRTKVRNLPSISYEQSSLIRNTE